MNLFLRLISSLILLLFFVFPVNAQQGCCSWHGGVDYCDTSVGRYVCNDGTYSPTCDCYYEPPIQVDPPSQEDIDELLDGFEEYLEDLTPTPLPTATTEYSNQTSEASTVPALIGVSGIASLLAYYLYKNS